MSQQHSSIFGTKAAQSSSKGVGGVQSFVGTVCAFGLAIGLPLLDVYLGKIGMAEFFPHAKPVLSILGWGISFAIIASFVLTALRIVVLEMWITGNIPGFAGKRLVFVVLGLGYFFGVALNIIALWGLAGIENNSGLKGIIGVALILFMATVVGLDMLILRIFKWALDKGDSLSDGGTGAQPFSIPIFNQQPPVSTYRPPTQPPTNNW